MSAANRISLEKRLAALLGISVDDDRDYLSDVLESLIDIGDSPEDVAEYLSSFVASGDADGGDVDLQQFSEDVRSFKLGEDFSSVAGMTSDDVDKLKSSEIEAKPKPKILLDEAAAQREEIKRREIEAREKQRLEQELLKKKKDEELERQRRMEAEAAKKKREQSKWGNNAATAVKQAQQVNSQHTVTKSAAKQTQSKGVNIGISKGTSNATKKNNQNNTKARKQKSMPEKGIPKNKPCGCFGNKHKPLTNCLRCGRISCEQEGIDDYCHFCGYYIEDYATINTTGDAKADSALKHKERLLEFDRTSAARTHIHDDQEDYFVASTSMWASEQEQEDARALEEERQKKLHERQKLKLNINF